MQVINCVEKYSYSYGLFPEHLRKEKIKLPVKQDGNPDWEYMEKYILNIENDFKKLRSTTIFKKG